MKKIFLYSALLFTITCYGARKALLPISICLKTPFTPEQNEEMLTRYASMPLDELQNRDERFAAVHWYREQTREINQKILAIDATPCSVLDFIRQHHRSDESGHSRKLFIDYMNSGSHQIMDTFLLYGSANAQRLIDYYNHSPKQRIVDGDILNDYNLSDAMSKIFHRGTGYTFFIHEGREWDARRAKIKKEHEDLQTRLQQIADGSLAEALAQQSKVAKKERYNQPEAATDDNAIDDEDKLS